MGKDNNAKPNGIADTVNIQGGFTGSDKLKPTPPSNNSTDTSVNTSGQE